MDMDSSSHNLIVGATAHRVSTKYQLGRRDKATRVKHSIADRVMLFLLPRWIPATYTRLIAMDMSKINVWTRIK